MAQLSQDCFASGAQILSVEDAVAAIVERFDVAPVATAYESAYATVIGRARSPIR